MYVLFMTQENLIFDILQPAAFRKYSTCWIENLKKPVDFEEICACMHGQCNSCKSIAWFCSLKTESK